MCRIQFIISMPTDGCPSFSTLFHTVLRNMKYTQSSISRLLASLVILKRNVHMHVLRIYFNWLKLWFISTQYFVYLLIIEWYPIYQEHLLQIKMLYCLLCGDVPAAICVHHKYSISLASSDYAWIPKIDLTVVPNRGVLTALLNGLNKSIRPHFGWPPFPPTIQYIYYNHLPIKGFLMVLICSSTRPQLHYWERSELLSPCWWN